MFKIVPIEGSVAVNGTAQKQAGEMGAEALISLTLSRLRDPGEAWEALEGKALQGCMYREASSRKQIRSCFMRRVHVFGT